MPLIALEAAFVKSVHRPDHRRTALARNSSARPTYCGIESLENRQLLCVGIISPIAPVSRIPGFQMAGAPVAEASLAPASSSNPVTIDLMILYTAAARAAEGGTDAGMLRKIQSDIAYTNQALINSQVYITLRLVDAE